MYEILTVSKPDVAKAKGYFTEADRLGYPHARTMIELLDPKLPKIADSSRLVSDVDAAIKALPAAEMRTWRNWSMTSYVPGLSTSSR